MDQHDREEEIRERVGETVDRAREDPFHGDEIDRAGILRSFHRLLTGRGKRENHRLWRRFERDQISRRRFLALLGIGAGGMALASAGAGTLMGSNLSRLAGVNPYTGRAGDEGQVRDSDDILGADPSGWTAVSFDGGDLQAAIDGLGSGEKLVVPAGTHTVSDGLRLTGSDKGVIGEPGAELRFTGGDVYVNGDRLLFEGFTVDQSDTSTVTLRPRGQGWAIRDIRFKGPATTGGKDHQIFPRLDGDSAILENIWMPEGAAPEECNHVTGMWAGLFAGGGYANNGEMYFRNLWMEGYGTNSAYTRNGESPFYYQGGLFKNTNVGVRVGTEGTRVQGVHIMSTAPVPGQPPQPSESGCASTQRGIWLQEPFDDLVIEDCDIVMDGPHAAFAIGTHDDPDQNPTIRNCRITSNVDSTPIIIDTSGGPVEIEGCHITGTGSGPAISVTGDGRSGSVARNCCITRGGLQGTIRNENSCIGSDCDCQVAERCEAWGETGGSG